MYVQHTPQRGDASASVVSDARQPGVKCGVGTSVGHNTIAGERHVATFCEVVTIPIKSCDDVTDPVT